MSILRMFLLTILLASAVAPSFAAEVWAEAGEKPKAGEVRVDFAIVSIPEKEAVVLLAEGGPGSEPLFADVAKLVEDGRGRTEVAAGETAADGARTRIALGPTGRPAARGEEDLTARIDFIAKQGPAAAATNLQVRLEHFRGGQLQEGNSLESVTTSIDCHAGRPMLLAVARPTFSAKDRKKAARVHFVFVKIELAAEDNR